MSHRLCLRMRLTFSVRPSYRNDLSHKYESFSAKKFWYQDSSFCFEIPQIRLKTFPAILNLASRNLFAHCQRFRHPKVLSDFFKLIKLVFFSAHSVQFALREISVFNPPKNKFTRAWNSKSVRIWTKISQATVAPLWYILFCNFCRYLLQSFYFWKDCKLWLSLWCHCVFPLATKFLLIMAKLEVLILAIFIPGNKNYLVLPKTSNRMLCWYWCSCQFLAQRVEIG